MYINLQKKIKKTASILLLTLVFLPVMVGAQADSGPSLNDNLEKVGEAAKYDTGQKDVTSLAAIIGAVIGYFFSLLGIIFLGLMIYAAFLWMTAHGNEDNVTKAKSIIRNAIIGLIILVGSYAIVYFVLAALGSGNVNSNLQGF